MVNNYSRAHETEIKKDLAPIMLTYSQEEAGFDCPISEQIHYVDDPISVAACKYLFKNRVLPIAGHTIVADTPATLMTKLHQLASGTVITDNDSLIISKCKALYIKETFKGKRIAIYYKFTKEFEVIANIFPSWTLSPEDFQKGLSNTFVSQISSGREGITLSTADCIVFYNIDYSAVSYWQARARLQSLDRKEPACIHWIFTKGGIEDRVYKAVSQKKDFTASYFFKTGGL
jgi:hypothetical protein